MTQQLWAALSADGSFNLLYTASIDEHPADHGCADACDGKEVFPLSREPNDALGELVGATGAIEFSPDKAALSLVPLIKSSAAKRIEAFAPIWRQLNDLADPQTPDALARRGMIDAVRAWSNNLEQRVLSATGTIEIEQILVEIASDTV